MIQQLTLGSGFLFLCLIFHVFALSFCVPLLVKVGRWVQRANLPLRMISLVMVALIVIVGSHTVQIWIWASYLLKSGAIQEWNAAVYFSTATYTTLGYGDIVLGEDTRIFGSFASITGLFAFGLSTAFIVGLMARLFPKSLAGRPES